MSVGLYKASLLDKYQDYLVTLDVPNIGSISGFLDSETLDIGLSATWGNTALSGSWKDFLKGASKSLIGKIPVIGKMGQDFIGNFKTVNNTINLWESPGDISLTLTINIIYGVNTNNWRDIDSFCNKCTQSNYRAYEQVMMPYFYKAETLKDVTVGNYEKLDASMGSISIGKHFRADKLKFDTLNKSYSTYITEDGKPLYMKLTVGASAYRSLDAEELTSWWKGI